jgi:Lrp/AsnC family transcriptional regulator, leucine-responsive regulatory protein
LVIHSFAFACFISLRNAEDCRKIELSARNRRISAPFCGFRAVKKRLDEFDLKLLEQVQQNNRFSADELAEKVCLSPSSVQRRLRRLRQAKIIEREVAIVSPEALGRGLTAIVEVTLDTDRPKAVDEFQRAIQAMPEVMQGYYITGNADFILIVTARNMEDYEEFASRSLSKARYVKHLRTSVVMRRVKWGVALPVRAAEDAPSSKRFLSSAGSV